MRSVLRSLLVAALAATAFTATAQAQTVPEMLPYNGFLADSAGTPVDGSINLTVRVYETSDAVNPIWQETLQNVGVDAGYFRVDLGQIAPLVQEVQAGRTRYLGLSVNGDAEATPRQRIGAVPYALMAMNSSMLGGNPAELYVTIDRLNQELAGRGYVTEARVRELIAELAGEGGEGGLNEAQVNALIDARNYLSEDAINALIDARGYVTEAQVDALIDARGYVTEAQVNALIDARAQAIAENVVNNAINNLRDELRQEIAAAAAGGQAYILGRSAQTSNGRFSFGGVNGIQAANAMCAATFADEATAHFCSPAEVQQAVATGSYDANNRGTYDNTGTWTVAPVTRGANFNNSDANTCLTLRYNSADAARGTRLTVDFDHQSGGNGGGVVGTRVVVQSDIACNNNMPVLCCR